ncbi:MAG: hypothetical protein IT303_15825 [Dehalococcoidia bacterium]|nr:hypothetical protein [Dehalococcoidia bacterium]
MIVVGSIIVLVIFLGFGWAIFTEMFQHRAWRRRVESGDVAIVAALIEEALATWRRARPPRGTSAHLWAGVQGMQLVAVTSDGATVSSAAEGEFRTESGRRVQVSPAIDEAIALATKLGDMMLYDVPNLRLGWVRVDIYSTFTGADGTPVQQPILTTTMDRATADSLTWESFDAEELLARFETRYERSSGGQAVPIMLDPVEGTLPEQPVRPEGAEIRNSDIIDG